ncbi:MAG TPA: hypothetical protein VG845_02325 [Dehalococcoidia bacterium]|nr:hypothetical protein [Dehalococcoidia bacterium]
MIRIPLKKAREVPATPRDVAAMYVSEFGQEMKSYATDVMKSIRNGSLIVPSDADSDDRLARVRRLRREMLHRLDEELVLLDIEDRLRRSVLLESILGAEDVTGSRNTAVSAPEQASSSPVADKEVN